jgi:hypothetical protein
MGGQDVIGMKTIRGYQDKTFGTKTVLLVPHPAFNVSLDEIINFDFGMAVYVMSLYLAAGTADV